MPCFLVSRPTGQKSSKIRPIMQEADDFGELQESAKEGLAQTVKLFRSTASQFSKARLCNFPLFDGIGIHHFSLITYF